MELRTLMRRAAQYNSWRPAVQFRGEVETYEQAWRNGIRLANGLLAAGLKPGDRLGVLEDNCLDSAHVIAGAASANLVRVPLYARNSAESHVYMLSRTEARGLLVAERYAGVVDEIRRALPEIVCVIVRDSSYGAWLQAQSDIDPDVTIDKDDLVLIRHTAGTTGKPKAVAYTHRKWILYARDLFSQFPPVEPGDRILHVAPVSHGSGYFFMPIWQGGGANILLDTYDPAETLEILERERVNYMFCVPTILQELVRQPGAADRDWSALKLLQVGGAPLSETTLAKARHVFGDCLYTTYGQTEVLATAMGPKEWFAELPGSNQRRSVGRALHFSELSIRGPEFEELPVGAEGEIAVRNEHQMDGYLNDPLATKERMVNGWILTGDLGRLDANGYLYLLDRKDDLIISGGFNIWPAELENVIAEDQRILEVAVYGVPDERWGEVPAATCVVAPGPGAPTEAEIVALCRERLGSYKKPARVDFQFDPLPRSAVGKVLRKSLRESHWVGHQSNADKGH